ncbi:MAG: tRNA (adenosine(37)-N6)-dimethylallyltransferase MiaA [Xanthobacteraceae bacterium]
MQNRGKRLGALLIAGPTASGKSALALALAEKFGGTIINSDSMQVYRDLRIITARPTPEEQTRVPHLLYGGVDAGENYSVGRWYVDVRNAMAQARTAGRLPILVGGTGLYFKVLTHGLAAIPPIPSAIREAVRARLEAEGPLLLHGELTRRDPAAGARIKPQDRPRIARALEVIEATGRTLSDWHQVGMPALLDSGQATKVFLVVAREELYRRIDARFTAMLAAGALAEVAALDARGLDPRLPAMKAHGVPWLRRHLKGEISLEQAAAGGQRDTRQYAKRQHTWFRHQLPDWIWLTVEEAPVAIERLMQTGSA